MTYEAFDWYGAKNVAKTETGAVQKSDYRMPSVAQGELVCRCAANIKLNDFKQTGCKWYVDSKYRRCCMYDRFDGTLCDKVVIDGNEIN